MALQKQSVPINFTQGLDLKSDPFQLQTGKFLTLVNSVFTTTARLTKRNGFANITTLPDLNENMLTTFNGNLIATGSNLYAFSQDSNQWINKGLIQPVELSTLPLVRSNTSQTSPDTAISDKGLTCLVYIDTGVAYYQIIDSVTGQQIVSRTNLPATAVCPRAFVLKNYFVITYLATVASSTHLQYLAIPIMNPLAPRAPMDFATDVKSIDSGYDGLVINNNLYLSVETGTAVALGFILPSLNSSAQSVIAGASASLISIADDISMSRVFVSYYDGTDLSTVGFNYSLQIIMAPTVVDTVDVVEVTSIGDNGTATLFYEVLNDYGYDSAIRTDYISSAIVTLPVSGVGVGTVSTPVIILRSVGLASKAFIGSNGTVFMLVAYGDTNANTTSQPSNQPTYFLIDSVGNIYMKLAYSNGGGYVESQVLPSVSLVEGQYYVAYLNNDFLATVNKGTNLPGGTPTSAIYTQTGVNLAVFSIENTQHTSEIAGTLNLTGGMLWSYDGVKPVENNFHVWPENVEVTTDTSAGGILAGTYYYQFTYEWTNNQGNLERSAPSIPISIVTTGGASENTLNIPTLRLTYKNGNNPVRIVGYRWSVAQQVYYQFTSLTQPVLNDTTIDYVTIVDTLSDAQILGNVILYTTGGVVEDISPPASIDSALFDNRLWLIDAEDQNLLWFSKQVIENVPVEMSDLLTIYVAPTTSAQGSTGFLTAIYPMDDKLILFKKDAAYYINGSGPDNTGLNSQYSQPIFITASVGCNDPDSIVLIPNGLMFQSDKGIWLLGRDLSTTYIGAPVEGFNLNQVLSATAIPATTQVRFIMNNNTTLMYDYFYNQWGTHTNILAISSTLYQGFHTYLNSLGQVFQELPNTYVDGSEPVLMSFTTSWMNVAGLQGYERFYFFYLLGTYYSPFKLNMTMAFDYEQPSQSVIVTPDSFNEPWGGEPLWGSGNVWGGASNIFKARIFPQQQKCESFQISMQEIYDYSISPNTGQGLALSGMNMIMGVKKGYRVQKASRSFG